MGRPTLGKRKLKKIAVGIDPETIAILKANQVNISALLRHAAESAVVQLRKGKK